VLPDDLATDEILKGYRHVVRLEDSPELRNLPTKGLSRFKAPTSVRVSANTPATGREIDLHFVNYNREEPTPLKDGKPNPGRGIEDERPISVKAISVDFRLPEGHSVDRVEFLTPEAAEPSPVTFRQSGGRVAFNVPEFLVYGIARIRLESVAD
jgi:hypothetical protein